MIRSLIDDEVLTYPYGVRLFAVHGGAAGNVWVVGGRVPFFASPYLTVARRWNGTSWAQHDRAPVFAAGTSLATVFADSTDGAWVSGQPPDDAPVQRFTGGTWSTETAGAGYFTGTPTDFTVLDSYASATPAELAWDTWNGSTWAGTSASGPTNAADYLALFLGGAGGAWGPPQLATQRPDGTIYAAGNATTATQLLTVVLHRHTDGTVHEARRILGSCVNRAIWAPTDTDVYHLIHSSGASVLAHTDGTPGVGLHELWFDVSIPIGGWDLLHGVAVDDWWLVGAGGNAAHWDGGSYSADTLPAPALGGAWGVTGLWAVATDDIWACGRGIDPGTSLDYGIAWHWDGASWTVQHLFTT